MQSKQVTIERMEAMLAQLSAKIERLAATIEDHPRTDLLKVLRAEAQARLDRFRALGSEQWEGIEPELATAWSELECAMIQVDANPGRARR